MPPSVFVPKQIKELAGATAQPLTGVKSVTSELQNWNELAKTVTSFLDNTGLTSVIKANLEAQTKAKEETPSKNPAQAYEKGMEAGIKQMSSLPREPAQQQTQAPAVHHEIIKPEIVIDVDSAINDLTEFAEEKMKENSEMKVGELYEMFKSFKDNILFKTKAKEILTKYVTLK